MFTVIVAGVRGNQVHHLRSRLPRDIRIRACRLSQLLRMRSLGADLVLCTRFVSHKHTWHLEDIIQARVVSCPGGIGSWATAIREECSRRRAAPIQNLAC
jgi:hypothetical protein